MSWDVDLINACKAKNFDLSITVTKHSERSSHWLQRNWTYWQR